MAKKVKLNIIASTNLNEITYRFLNESDLDTVIRAYIEDDEEAMDEIDEYGVLEAYYVEELLDKPCPAGLPKESNYCVTMDYLSISEVKAVVDGEEVFSDSDKNKCKEITKEKLATAAVQEEDFRKPVFDLIKEGKHDKIYAFVKTEADHIDVNLEYEFEIEGEFDFNKFQFIKVYGSEESVLAYQALYDGKLIKGERIDDYCLDHIEFCLSTFTADGEDVDELDSF